MIDAAKPACEHEELVARGQFEINPFSPNDYPGTQAVVIRKFQLGRTSGLFASG